MDKERINSTEHDMNLSDLLTSNPEHVNIQNPEGFTPLHLAVKDGNYDAVVEILKIENCDPNISNEFGICPIHIACKNAIPNTVDDPTSIDSANSVEESIVQLLIEDKRVDINVFDYGGLSPILIAALTGSIKILTFLIRKGVNLNIKSYSTALCIACESNFVNMAKLLLEHGADPNQQDIFLNTPLHHACSHSSKELIKILIKQQARVNVVNADGKKPYHLTTDEETKLFLNGKRTSESHPLQVDFLEVEVIGSSRIGISMCPGRRKNIHHRDLNMDIDVLKNHGVEVIFTLVQTHELESMGIPHFFDQLRDSGLEVYHAPIRDKWIPKSMDYLFETIEIILSKIKEGRTILVHCNGGKGRAGLVVASTLIALGLDVSTSVSSIRAVRSGSLYNPIQLLYLQSFIKDVRRRQKRE